MRVYIIYGKIYNKITNTRKLKTVTNNHTAIDDLIVINF